MKAYVLSILLLIFSIEIFSQGYEIPVKINHLTDSMIYLGNHFGNGYFITDSCKLDKQGQLVYKGNKTLQGGIYFLFLPGGKYFDFLIDKHQHFSISCDTIDFLNTVSFKNSYQNEKFFNYQKYLNQQYSEINKLKETQKKHIAKIDSIMLIEDNIQLIYNKIYLKKEEIISQNPDSLISVILKAGLPIVPPPSPVDKKGRELDSLFSYKYVKTHYFDNLNFADARLLRTSILQNKVLEYLTQMVVPHYDSICIEVDKVVSKAAANEEVYKFVLNTLFQFYNKSSVISDENVFVYIAEKYYLAGKTPWVQPELKNKLIEELNRRKPNLVGTIAPDFKMKDNKDKLVGLRETQNKYTILYFYDADCEVCKAVTPEMNNFYKIIKDRGVNLIGIYVGNSKTIWNKYIEENHLNWINVWDPDNKTGFREKYNIAGTPVIFLLDENQKILSKKISVEQLMGYFNSI